MSLFHVLIYPTSALYSLFISLFHLPRPFVLPNAHSLSIPFWFCRDMLLGISIPLSFPLFKRNSRISSMLFIVCSAIPLYQLQFWATEVISFCIGGSEEQRYVRPRAAYLSNANRLDLSKSHWNHITYSSLAKYLQNEEGVKTGEPTYPYSHLIDKHHFIPWRLCLHDSV